MGISKRNQSKLYAAGGGGFRFSTGLFVVYSNHRKTNYKNSTRFRANIWPLFHAQTEVTT